MVMAVDLQFGPASFSYHDVISFAEVRRHKRLLESAITYARICCLNVTQSLCHYAILRSWECPRATLSRHCRAWRTHQHPCEGCSAHNHPSNCELLQHAIVTTEPGGVLLQIFTIVDTDGSGQISALEVKHLMGLLVRDSTSSA
jgi:hypothetical protein